MDTVQLPRTIRDCKPDEEPLLPNGILLPLCHYTSPARFRFDGPCRTPSVSHPSRAAAPPSTPGVPPCAAAVLNGVDECPRLCKGGGGSAGPPTPGAAAYRSSFGLRVLIGHRGRYFSTSYKGPRKACGLNLWSPYDFNSATHLVFTCCLAECRGNEPRM